jgi:hypothetical protein
MELNDLDKNALSAAEQKHGESGHRPTIMCDILNPQGQALAADVVADAGNVPLI